MYSKESQLRKNGKSKDGLKFGQRGSRGSFGTKKYSIKKKSVKSLASVEDREYLEYLKGQDLRCFKCGKRDGVELHHIKEYSMQKKNHKEVIPLCGVECHRLGVELSAHGTAKKFREVFALEVQLKFARELYRNYKESLC